MKKFLSIAIMVIVAAGITLGFIMEDPHGSKTQSSSTSKTPTTVNQVNSPTGTVIYLDDFDGANDTVALKLRGYKPYYRGTGAQGLTATWYQGSTAVFNSFNGPATGYVAANYNVVTGTNNIDSWLVLPRVSGGLIAGDSLYFYERSNTGSTYPDSVRVMYSANDSIPEGTWVELGRFQTNITTGWERKGFRAPTSSANGRFAIRYCVANGGPTGSTSDYMGIDALTIERSASPIPTGTWTEQTSGITTTALFSISAVSDDVAWTCGDAGKVLRTTNKGVTWTNVSGTIPAALPLYSIYAWDANTAIVTGTTSGGVMSLYNTTNGGTTWTLANTHTGFGDDLFMTDANTAYYIGDPVSGNWDMLKSTNAGANWAAWATLPTTNTLGTYNNAFWQQGTQIWFPNVGLSQMYYSSNMGANWTTQTISLSQITATCFTSATRGLAAGSSTSPGLLGTTDGGTTWTTVTQSFIGTSSVSGIVGASTTWWAALQAQTVYKSTNDGAAFTLDYTAPTAGGVFYHMTKSRTGATIWGVRSLGGISRYGTVISGVTHISVETPSSYSVSQNYPNPFNPTTKINFALPKSGLVTLKVYDMLGKEVATLVNEVKNVGTYSVDFNASTLSSGIYFYKVSVNGFSEVKKMMLIK
jgi:photosystem II stability/assembly factor-like uncharacterized protein